MPIFSGCAVWTHRAAADRQGDVIADGTQEEVPWLSLAVGTELSRRFIGAFLEICPRWAASNTMFLFQGQPGAG